MRTGIRRYPLASFFALAYALSWILWTPFVLLGDEAAVVSSASWILGGFGPLLAGLMVSGAVSGRAEAWDFLRRIFIWRHRPKWYAVALLLPIALYAVAMLVHLVVSGSPQDYEPPPIYAYPLALLYVAVLGGGQEEPGWRGFALPELLSRHTPFVSSMVLGVVWALWHLPLFFAPTATQSGFPFTWYFVNALALSTIFTWLYLKTGGSVLLAIVLHAGVNAPSAWAFPELFESYVLFTAVTWVAAVALVVAYGVRSFFGEVVYPDGRQEGLRSANLSVRSDREENPRCRRTNDTWTS